MSAQPEPASTATDPAVAPSSTNSGPLSRIEGLETLQEIVAKKPGDIGAHMALAVAYAQAGHTDHAMYEYHRLLQQRQIPAPMLQLISDQVADMESEAGHYTIFITLARKYAGTIDVEKRWKDFLAYEARVVQNYGKKETIHG